ncbi:MAG: hypothetical protein WCW78_03195 [Candidatus Paceibacterota bacterium]|jgi:hypothetical protein
MTRTRWYLEAVLSNAEDILTHYPEFQKSVLSEDILHNIKDNKGTSHGEIYHCDYEFITQFKVYVNKMSKANGDDYQFIDLFRVFVRYDKDPLKDMTSTFKVRRWKKNPLHSNKKK